MFILVIRFYLYTDKSGFNINILRYLCTSYIQSSQTDSNKTCDLLDRLNILSLNLLG